MSNYDPPGQQPWGGPPQDPFGGPPQYSNPPGQPGAGQHGAGHGGFPPPPPPGGPSPTSAFPAGGAFPPPSDPFSAPPDPYGQTSAGFPPPPPGGGYPGDQFGAPGGGGYGGGYPQSPPQQPRRSGGSKVLLTIAGVVLLLLCAGGAFVAYKLVNDKDDKNNADPGTTASAGASTPASAGSTGKASPSASTRGNGGTNPDTLVKGDCFVNDGSDSSPKLRKVPCTTAGAYQVVAKVTGTNDETQCDTRGPGKGNWNAHYEMDKPGTSGDYVLCLKGR